MDAGGVGIPPWGGGKWNKTVEAESERKGRETSVAAHTCFLKASLCLLGIPTVYLVSLYSAASLPKGHVG